MSLASIYCSITRLSLPILSTDAHSISLGSVLLCFGRRPGTLHDLSGLPWRIKVFTRDAICAGVVFPVALPKTVYNSAYIQIVEIFTTTTETKLKKPLSRKNANLEHC